MYFYSSVTEHCKGGKEENLIEKLTPSFGLRNPYRNLKSENSQDNAQKPQRNSTFMNLTSVSLYCKPISAVGSSKPNSNSFLISYTDLYQKQRKIIVLPSMLLKVKTKYK